MKIIYLASDPKDDDFCIIKKATGDTFEQICIANKIDYANIVRIEK